jgi:hypothetical protein
LRGARYQYMLCCYLVPLLRGASLTPAPLPEGEGFHEETQAELTLGSQPGDDPFQLGDLLLQSDHGLPELGELRYDAG